jgi:hypothetical protein
MAPPSDATDIAAGPGPREVRRALVGLAALYYIALLYHPTDVAWIRPATFFTEATCLFPRAVDYSIEYRLEGWSCGHKWAALDPRPYFPIRPDDKESTLQRLGYFYQHNRTVMEALDAFISARHAAGADDGIAGPIGGIRLFKAVRPIPEVGAGVERYHFDPLAPVQRAERRDLYYTPGSERKARCASP